LFKEYVITDLSRYEEGKVGFRWRIEREVFSGKGQFICANKTCENTEKLVSYEVNFSYFEHDVSKNALVKCRLCPDCSVKTELPETDEKGQAEAEAP
jgi:protein FRA10AC1